MINKATKPLLLLCFILMLVACQKSDCDKNPEPGPQSSKYFVLSLTPTASVPGLTFLGVESFQQTTEYTCGPAAVLSLLKFYGKTGDEMSMAGEMGTSNLTGTTPQQMTTWLNAHNFTASWQQGGSLEILRQNLANNRPTLVEWSDWGGHWVLVIGYDTRNTDDPMDDVIIFADPYDRHDDSKDGYTWFNAQRFYYMWYDALLFGSLMKQVYITATPNS